MKTFGWIILAIAGVTGCTPGGGMSGYKYNTVALSDTPINLVTLNSAYDDYNSTAPWGGGDYPFCFSSNRNSQGKNFDFVFTYLNVSMSKIDGSSNISASVNTSGDFFTANQNVTQALTRINSAADEFGPYMVPQGDMIRKNTTNNQNYFYQSYVFLYASNDKGNLDIRFTENVAAESYSAPKDLSFLNSSANDAYPVFTKDTSAIYFCSDRAGNFDIYKAAINHTTGKLVQTLSDQSGTQVIKDTELSSAYNDKCPFILDNLMVFTSDRPGGFGGFDLYYSLYKDGKWSAPVNFGSKINSAADEYRPIVKYVDGFSNNFLIFSSNRAGGKGGFDLYYVGIERISN